MLSETSADQSVKESEAPSQPIEKIFVKSLQDKQVFNSTFLVRERSMLTGKNGKNYLSAVLADSSGSVDARVWDNVESVSELLQAGDIVHVKGQVQLFQNRKQVIVHRVEKTIPGDYRVEDYVSAAARQPEEMMAELIAIAESISDRNIRQITIDVLQDPEIRPKLLLAPAAKTIHHAYVGGLLEHILSICGIMKLLAPHYERQGIAMKLDYLLFGAIFHDIGKIWELDHVGGITYTDRGKLIGHMVMAVELVEKKASRILGFPDELKDLLKHIILSHHGKLEYGSPKLPMFLEAFLVAAIDDLDSKINTIGGFIRNESESGEKWSKFNQLFERYFMLKA